MCFAVASLISCLHELRSENSRLEKEVGELVSRRDNLLAINARLKLLPSSENSLSSSVPYSSLSMLSTKAVPPNETAAVPFTGYMSFENSVVHSTQVSMHFNFSTS